MIHHTELLPRSVVSESILNSITIQDMYGHGSINMFISVKTEDGSYSSITGSHKCIELLSRDFISEVISNKYDHSEFVLSIINSSSRPLIKGIYASCCADILAAASGLNNYKFVYSNTYRDRNKLYEREILNIECDQFWFFSTYSLSFLARVARLVVKTSSSKDIKTISENIINKGNYCSYVGSFDSDETILKNVFSVAQVWFTGGYQKDLKCIKSQSEIVGDHAPFEGIVHLNNILFKVPILFREILRAEPFKGKTSFLYELKYKIIKRNIKLRWEHVVEKIKRKLLKNST